MANSTSAQSNNSQNRKRAFSTPHITPAFAQQMLSASIGTTGTAQGDLPPLLLLPSGLNGNEPNVYFYNKTSSGRSSFCVDESLWPTGLAPRFVNVNSTENVNQQLPPVVQQIGSDSNIYTNLALGNERYKLPIEFTTSLSPGASLGHQATTQMDLANKGDNDDDDDEFDDCINENEEDIEEESVDQFSPLLYPTTNTQRSQPIAISAGNSPVHKPKSSSTSDRASGQNSPLRVTSPTHHKSQQQLHQQHVAFSASPTAGAFPYSPFFGGSPDSSQTNIAGQQQQHVSYSYDPAFGTNMNRLILPSTGQQQQHQQPQQHQRGQLPKQPPLPQQRHSQPSTSAAHFISPIQPTQKLSTSSVESAPGAIIFATSPTASLTNRSVQKRRRVQ